jgi:hypothetical protein
MTTISATRRLAAKHLGGKELIADLNLVKDGKATGDNAMLLKVFAKIGAVCARMA